MSHPSSALDSLPDKEEVLKAARGKYLFKQMADKKPNKTGDNKESIVFHLLKRKNHPDLL